ERQYILPGEVPLFSSPLFAFRALVFLLETLFYRDDTAIDGMESRPYQRSEFWTRSVGPLSDQRHELLRLIRLNIDEEKRRSIRRSILLYLTEQRLFHQRHRDNHHHA